MTAISLSDSFVTVTTTANYVRIYTLFGVPYRVFRQKSSPTVTCASWRDYVLTLGNGPMGADGNAKLLYTIQNIKRDEICQSEDIVALPEGETVKSVFFSDKGVSSSSLVSNTTNKMNRIRASTTRLELCSPFSTGVIHHKQPGYPSLTPNSSLVWPLDGRQKHTSRLPSQRTNSTASSSKAATNTPISRAHSSLSLISRSPSVLPPSQRMTTRMRHLMMPTS